MRFIPAVSLVRIQLPLPHGPMVKRLRHRPFTAVSRVRFPFGSPYARIAQLVRALASHARGQRFESVYAHQRKGRMLYASGLSRLSKKAAGRKSSINFGEELQGAAFFSLFIQNTVGPGGANAFAFCVVRLLPYPYTPTEAHSLPLQPFRQPPSVSKT